MKLNQIPNFRVEDFPSEQSWIGRFFIQLNPFIQSVNQIFDKNIEFDTNIKSIKKDFDLTVFSSLSFTWPYAPTEPVSLEVVKAKKGNTLTPTILLCAWSYDASNSLITVSRMVEVGDAAVSALSGRYQFTIRATV